MIHTENVLARPENLLFTFNCEKPDSYTKSRGDGHHGHLSARLGICRYRLDERPPSCPGEPHGK